MRQAPRLPNPAVRVINKLTPSSALVVVRDERLGEGQLNTEHTVHRMVIDYYVVVRATPVGHGLPRQMDSFEAVVASILQRRGFWTQIGFKVELTRDEKRKVGRPSAPRWELDVIGYQGRTGELRVLECKSFLDSPGVRCSAFDGSQPKAQRRYKLFFDGVLRRVVLARMVKQLVAAGYCAPNPRVTLGLAAGRIHGDAEWLRTHRSYVE